jgi:hypothetical protein
MARPKDSERDAGEFTETEAAERMKAALRGAREVGHKTYEETKVGKREPSKPSPRPVSRQKRDNRSKPK